MTAISRPLSYSLLVHFLLLFIFIFSITHESKKETRTTLKLKMISLSSPTITSLPEKPTPSHPKEAIKSIPIQKPTPIAPTPVIQKTLPPAPTAQPIPTVIPQSIARPNIPVVAVAAPLLRPIETPKVTHTPIIPSVNVEKEFLDAHLGEIRALLIQNLKYPRNAQRLKMQGEVRIGFHLKSDGSVESIEVIQSSGFELLDEDAKALIKNTAPQFPKPTKSISLSIPLSYLLR
jgi:protein TonB